MKFFFLLTGGAGLLAIIFLFLNGWLSLSFSTTPHSETPDLDTQHAAGEAIPKRTRTPEEMEKDKAGTIKQNQLAKLPSAMGIHLDYGGWLLLTDEQGHRQGYDADATKYFDDIPVAYKPIVRTGLPWNGPPPQRYAFTEMMPITATIIGEEKGTYKYWDGTYEYWQTVGRHMLGVEKVQTWKGIRDTIRFNPKEDRYSIYFDPAGTERRGTFQLRDSMNYLKSMGKNVVFNGKDLPVIPGATLTFTDDIDAILSGKNGITIALDRNSDGQAERSVQIGGGQLTAEDSRQVDFTPEMPEFAELFGTETASQAKD